VILVVGLITEIPGFWDFLTYTLEMDWMFDVLDVAPAWDVVHADDGDVIVGSFESTVDIGATTLTSAGDDDVLLLKMSAAGQLAWAHGFGDAEEQWGLSVAVDDAGAIHVSGRYRSSIDFGDGVHSGELTKNLFYARFDDAGDVMKSRGFSLGTQLDPPYGSPAQRRVAVTPEGDAIIATLLTGTASFDAFDVAATPGSNDALLLRLSH